MNKVVLDDDLRAKLNGLNSKVEVCDTSGRTIGRFLPEDEYRRLMYDLARAEVSDAELDEARREPGGMTTPEAIAFIEQLIRSHGRKP